jgi:integrase
MRTASLTDAEFMRLLAGSSLRAGLERDLRPELAVRLIVQSGLPPSDLLGLRRTDWRPGSGVRAGGKLYAIPAEVEHLITRILDREAATEHLFESRGRPLSKVGLLRNVSRFGERRGVRGVTLEKLRRTYARRLHDDGASEEELLDRLDLSSPKHLRTYLRADPNSALARTAQVAAREATPKRPDRNADAPETAARPIITTANGADEPLESEQLDLGV